MSFGGILFTNRGRNLQAKGQTGISIQFTRIAVGDGSLGSSSIADLTALKNQIMSLQLNKIRKMTEGKAVVGASFSNQALASGFYYREVGLFATDPDIGEILYAYGNAGTDAEYIPAGGGPDILEKQIDLISVIGTAQNVSAVIDQSLVYLPVQEFNDFKEMAITTDKFTAANDFIVGTGAGAVAKKTLTETKTILGVNSATETATGVVELATSAEALAGTDAARVMTPSTLKAVFNAYGAVLAGSASATLQLTDANKVIVMGGASTQTITIPTNASVAFPTGTQITFIMGGAGAVVFAPASGVTLLSKDSKRTIDGTNASATLIKTATDGWYLIGALKA